MIFWIAVICFIAGIVWIHVDYYCDGGMWLTFLSGTIVACMLLFILPANLVIEGKIARYEARYEVLTYQLENDIYDNDNDLGKRDLMEDIQSWNEDLTYKQAIQDNFWIGIFYPNIYDQFEPIKLGTPG